LYAWYWPKDQEEFGAGHRHDWESTVVFINDVNAAPENQTIIEVAASAHGAFRQYNPPNPDTMEGTHVHIKYFTAGILDHSTDTWDNPTLGESPVLPIIHWDQLSPAARFTLQNYDFGSANFPLRDPNFMDNLASAYI
ncbi:necrosis inducing protein, partial [Zopfochytrium polystomum]